MQIVQLLQHTLRAESGCNPAAMQWSDGAGLTFGLIQWTQEGGGLGRLLLRMWRRHPDQVRAALGPSARRVVANLTSSDRATRMTPVDGEVLWSPSWRARFRKLGETPELQVDQAEEILGGPEFAAAIEACDLLGLQSTRALAFAFDVAVHMGAPTATKLAGQVADRRLAQGARLAAFAEAARAPFRRSSLAGVRDRSRWRQGRDGRWYRFAGPFDLWALRSARNDEILAATDLSDAVYGPATPSAHV